MRFIGGERLEECLDVVRSTTDKGHVVTVDFMGESTRDVNVIAAATREFLRIVQEIRAGTVEASISFDLSHRGLAVDDELCLQNATSIVEAASNAGLEVMISAEDTDRTDAVLALHGRLRQRYSNVGVTVQAYLHRTAGDLEAVTGRPGKVRVVKGAFDAPDTLALRRGEALDDAYVQCVQAVLEQDRACSVATHDPVVVSRTLAMIEQQGFDRALVEFEMLKGVAQKRLEALRDLGYRTRVYVPYGTEWYLYLCNRLAEYPPNIFRAIVDARMLESDGDASRQNG